MEAGAEDDRVRRVVDAVVGDEAVRHDPGDAGGDHVDVRPGERRPVVVGDQHPLAAHRVAGGELVPQVRVGDLTPQRTQGQARGEAVDRRVQEAQAHALAYQIEPCPGGPLRAGHGAERGLLDPADPARQPRHDPRGGALEERQLLDRRLDLRHELDGRGAGADHRDAPAGQVVVVPPTGGVEHRAGELVDPGQVGDGRVAERAGGTDQDPGAVVAAGGAQQPALALVVPPRLVHLVAQPQPRAYPEAVDAAAQVVPDLRLAGERVRPAGVGGEGERVEVRRDVAGAARVGVVTPGAADVLTPVEDDESR